jgi:mono/diheme cytochrome c family protein
MEREPTSRTVVVAVAFLLLWSSAAHGEDPEVGLNPDHRGYGLYQSHCAECHGVRADGKGPRADETIPPASDLTRLEGPEGGKLNREEVARVVDGRRTLRVHESGPMPIWGWVFVSNEPNLEPRERARRQLVYSLADYILSIQRPRPE